jgi:hypothetical protein
MKRIFRQTLSVLAVAATMSLSSCDSLTHDDMSECPEGMVIQLLPKYAAIGSFENEVNDVHIFIYDSSDKCVKELEVKGETLAANKYQVQVLIPEGDYHLVVWNGIDDTTNYTVDNCAVTLNTESDNSTSNSFTPLWHGAAADVAVEALQLTTVEVPMVKDTNNFVIFLCSTDGEALDPENFDFYITSSNGALARDNSLTESPEITYNDFNLGEDEIEGALDLDLVSTDDELGYLPVVRAELNTMRLTTQQPSYLTLVNKETSRRILKINLNDYIMKAFRSMNSTLTAQEYYDTEDLFNLTFFLNSNKQVNPYDPSNEYNEYYCIAISINDWVLRYQEVSLDNQ